MIIPLHKTIICVSQETPTKTLLQKPPCACNIETFIADNKKVDTWLKADTCKKSISV